MSARRTVAAMLGACSLGVALSLAFFDAGGDDAGASTAAAPHPSPPAATPGRLAEVATVADVPRAAAVRTTRHASPRAARVDAAAGEALCRRAVAAGPGGAEGMASSPANDPAVVAARSRIDAALRTSPDPFSQAVAAWLDAGQEAPAYRERRERLARLARATADPRVYALSYRQCRKGVDDEPSAACQALSALQWAQVDAGNAMPWVYVLGEAVARGDVRERDEALFRIASSARIEEGSFAGAQAILAASNADASSLVAADDLVSQALGMAAAQQLPLDALRSVCRGDAAEDANVAQSCAEVADLLVNRSDTLALRAIGIAMDFSLTGDAARRERLRSETPRLAALPTPDAARGCASLRETQAYLRRAGEIGQLGALAERAAASDAAAGSAAP